MTPPNWHQLLDAACRKSGDGHSEARAFLASVYDGPEPVQWMACINERCVLRVESEIVRDAAVLGPWSDVELLTVWGRVDAAGSSELLYQWERT